MGCLFHGVRDRVFATLVLSGVLVSFGCQRNIVFDASFAQEEISFPELIIPADSADSVWEGVDNPALLREFYIRNNQKPAWTAQETISIQGDSLLNFLREIRYRGLLPQHYHVEELSVNKTPSWKPEHLLRRDVLLTDAFLTLSKDLRLGRLAPHPVGDDTMAVHLLMRALRDVSVVGTLTSLEPGHKQYSFLLKELRKAIDGANAFERIQLMNGITLDSIPIHRRVQTIEVNLERWRLESFDWSGRFVFVNIPAFMVEVVEEGQVVLESRVIVGKPDHPTPEFSSVIQCFVTYPYWNVPRKIAVDEFLPVIQRDTAFIRRNNFDILDRRGNILNPDSVKWKTFSRDNFPVRLRQREGRENSLGRLKFIFDNRYAVFLHDTNAPQLFRHAVRTFSHGCIRVEEATRLAHYFVTGEVGKRSPIVQRYLDQEVRHTIDLANPIPIHIRYFTASERKGMLVLADDVYRKDERLIRLLYSEATR